MRKKIDKIAAVFIVSIFALSGVSMAYAAWTDTIYIDGTVDTGSLCWEFVSCSMTDEAPPVNYGGDFPVPTYLADYTCLPGFPLTENGYFWHLDKNVAWGEQQKYDHTRRPGHDPFRLRDHKHGGQGGPRAACIRFCRVEL